MTDPNLSPSHPSTAVLAHNSPLPATLHSIVDPASTPCTAYLRDMTPPPPLSPCHVLSLMKIPPLPPPVPSSPYPNVLVTLTTMSW